MFFQSPPPPVYDRTEEIANRTGSRVKKNRNSLNAPAIHISNPNDLHDSGIGQDVGVTQLVSRPRSRHGKAGSDGGSSHSNQLNGLDAQENGGYADNGIQYDMDPLEYEFLQQQTGADEIVENGLLMDSLAINSNSLSGSRSSLVCSLYFSLLFSTPLYSTLLYSTLLYSTLLYSTLLYSTLLYSTLNYSTLL